MPWLLKIYLQRYVFILAGSALILMSLIICRNTNPSSPPMKLVTEYTIFFELANSPLADLPKKEAWQKVAPEVQEITVPSTADDSEQPALFYHSGSSHKKPLLLVLHSWSADYRQHFSIPYGVWAVRNDWIFIHPNFRGDFDNPEATASEKVIQDVLDALQYAKENAPVDESRIYLAGFSGGGMLTLIMVGKYPEIWAGALAWVPVYNLVEWYQTTQNATHDYSTYIENSCGGPPLPGTAAEKECLKRSPVTYLKNARNKDVQVYIATGIEDEFVPPDHSLKAFNDLADKGERFSEDEIEYIVSQNKIPETLQGQYKDSLYATAGKTVLLERISGNALIKIFSGGHDVIYNAGLLWLSRQKK